MRIPRGTKWVHKEAMKYKKESKAKFAFRKGGASFYVVYGQERKVLKEEKILAHTIGKMVFAVSRRALSPAIIRHELVHVTQYRTWGWFFTVLYYLGDLLGYGRNPFEIAARAAERE